MVRFGPAGYPEGAKDGADAVEMVRNRGLDALELQFGRQVNMSDQRADAIRRKAEELDVRLSAHAPYYISFNSVPETYLKSKEWVLRTARVAAKAGAWIIVIHAATYAGKEPEVATEAVMRGLSECLDQMGKEGLDVVLGLETMGRASTWGTLEEIGVVTRSLKGVQPVVDFAHIHARYGGSLRTPDDFAQGRGRPGPHMAGETALPLQLHRVHQGGGETASPPQRQGPGLLPSGPLPLRPLAGVHRHMRDPAARRGRAGDERRVWPGIFSERAPT